MEDEKHWDDTLKEAVLFHSASHLRELFVTMIIFCHISNLNELWNKQKENKASDILQQHRHNLNNRELAITPQILNEALILVEDQLLKISGKMMSDFDMESPTRIEERDRQFLQDRDYLSETTYDANQLSIFVQENEQKLTDDQRLAYNTIIDNVMQNSGKMFFLDAPGGTGKMFLINLLLAKFRMLGKIALAVASSGIAATLLQN